MQKLEEICQEIIESELNSPPEAEELFIGFNEHNDLKFEINNYNGVEWTPMWNMYVDGGNSFHIDNKQWGGNFVIDGGNLVVDSGDIVIGDGTGYPVMSIKQKTEETDEVIEKLNKRVDELEDTIRRLEDLVYRHTGEHVL